MKTRSNWRWLQMIVFVFTCLFIHSEFTYAGDCDIDVSSNPGGAVQLIKTKLANVMGTSLCTSNVDYPCSSCAAIDPQTSFCKDEWQSYYLQSAAKAKKISFRIIHDTQDSNDATDDIRIYDLGSIFKADPSIKVNKVEYKGTNEQIWVELDFGDKYVTSFTDAEIAHSNSITLPSTGQKLILNNLKSRGHVVVDLAENKGRIEFNNVTIDKGQFFMSASKTAKDDTYYHLESLLSNVLIPGNSFYTITNYQLGHDPDWLQIQTPGYAQRPKLTIEESANSAATDDGVRNYNLSFDGKTGYSAEIYLINSVNNGLEKRLTVRPEQYCYSNMKLEDASTSPNFTWSQKPNSDLKTGIYSSKFQVCKDPAGNCPIFAGSSVLLVQNPASMYSGRVLTLPVTMFDQVPLDDQDPSITKYTWQLTTYKSNLYNVQLVKYDPVSKKEMAVVSTYDGMQGTGDHVSWSNGPPNWWIGRFQVGCSGCAIAKGDNLRVKYVYKAYKIGEDGVAMHKAMGTDGYEHLYNNDIVVDDKITQYYDFKLPTTTSGTPEPVVDPYANCAVPVSSMPVKDCIASNATELQNMLNDPGRCRKDGDRYVVQVNGTIELKVPILIHRDNILLKAKANGAGLRADAEFPWSQLLDVGCRHNVVSNLTLDSTSSKTNSQGVTSYSQTSGVVLTGEDNKLVFNRIYSVLRGIIVSSSIENEYNNVANMITVGGYKDSSQQMVNTMQINKKWTDLFCTNIISENATTQKTAGGGAIWTDVDVNNDSLDDYYQYWQSSFVTGPGKTSPLCLSWLLVSALAQSATDNCKSTGGTFNHNTATNEYSCTCPANNQRTSAYKCIPCATATSIIEVDKCVACGVNKVPLKGTAGKADKCVCKAGFEEYPTNSGTCIVKCPTGQVRDNLGVCIKSCPADQPYDYTTSDCTPKPVPVCSDPANMDPATCACLGGRVKDDTTGLCGCPTGTSWDGTACTAAGCTLTCTAPEVLDPATCTCGGGYLCPVDACANEPGRIVKPADNCACVTPAQCQAAGFTIENDKCVPPSVNPPVCLETTEKLTADAKGCECASGYGRSYAYVDPRYVVTPVIKAIDIQKLNLAADIPNVDAASSAWPCYKCGGDKATSKDGRTCECNDVTLAVNLSGKCVPVNSACNVANASIGSGGYCKCNEGYEPKWNGTAKAPTCEVSAKPTCSVGLVWDASSLACVPESTPASGGCSLILH